MKKIILSVFIILFVVSCIKKVDLEQKGSIALSINWNTENTQIENSNINRAIKSGTEKIEIRIHPKGDFQREQIKNITHTGAGKYTIEFDNLTEGIWHIAILATGTEGQPLSAYEDYVEVSSNKETKVTTNFTGLNNIFIYDGYISDYGYTIQNGAVDVSSGPVAIYFKGFQDLAMNNENVINPDTARIKFYNAHDNDSTQWKQISILGPQWISVDLGGDVDDGYGNMITYGLEPSTKYYWKAVIEVYYDGVTYTKESPFYNFTSGSGGQFTAP